MTASEKRARKPKRRLDAVICRACGRSVAGYVPRGGDGSGVFAVVHRVPDANKTLPPGERRCIGSRALATERAS